MNLQEFLNKNRVDGLTKEVAISNRFRDEKGELLKFKIKAITRSEYVESRKKAAKTDKKGNVIFDESKFEIDIIINNTVYPNFKDSQSLKETGASTASEYIEKVLLAGEIVELSGAIIDFSGFNNDIKLLIEEAKN